MWQDCSVYGCGKFTRAVYMKISVTKYQGRRAKSRRRKLKGVINLPFQHEHGLGKRESPHRLDRRPPKSNNKNGHGGQDTTHHTLTAPHPALAARLNISRTAATTKLPPANSCAPR